MADIDEAAAQEDVSSALDGIKDSVAAFTYDGDRTLQDHLSGAPEERDLVLGDDDPRDAGLAERPLTEDVVWTGRIFNVDRLQVQLPDGRTAIRDVVRHPGAVAIVALTDEGRICLVRQYRTALGRVTVEIPAGKLDPGEDPLECASRELLEETGMIAEKIAYLTTIATSDGFTDELIHIYMATGLSFSKSSPDADEFINVDLVEVGELVDAVLDGRIEDAKTVVGALLCDAISRRLEDAVVDEE
ncbi:NUDIX domain-containing protein [Thermophilibacter sp. ZX-H3]|jgi:ADP-ribose pyrophosphatase|uniref:NUDIX domain-containing protein n=1 Tax=Atopobiaceae TaxID=1643824 RepID=UPI00143A6B2F|nr:NUDIX hydrolase [Olsenella sp. SW781]NJE80989.1 NUDIX hydrolase [Olsenella sp. SW781]